ncbi:hypothetical protein RIVM261_079250 [Rivularia sp. IAM M-261]|nr:hypothetical protein RIVM261_079250 [Rivularia sp. IAM M-261]
MEGLSIEELTSIALIFKGYEGKYPIPTLFIEEIKCGITFDRESSKDEMVKDYLNLHGVDEDKLAAKLYNLLENHSVEFEKLFLGIEKFWEIEVTNVQERLEELGLIELVALTNSY